MIVLVCTTLFLLSMVFGSARGILLRFVLRQKLNRSIDRQHLLRALYELQEMTLERRSQDSADQHASTIPALLQKRSWSRARLLNEIRRSQSDELIKRIGDRVLLTTRGAIEAARLTRQHRLWELYLITHADVAPSLVDRDADAIEHVLEPVVVAELEELLQREERRVPESPHPLVIGSEEGGEEP